MTNEEFERYVEFSLQQQAKFDAGMEELRAAQAKTERTLNRAEENISHLGVFIHEGFGLVINLFKDTDEKFKETNAQFKDTDTKFRETDAKIEALRESQKLTDEQLRKLMGRVNHHLSEDHGLEN
jgi:chromosome segregation ATPase